MTLFFVILLQIVLISIGQISADLDEEARETNSCQERALPGYICDACDVLAICLKLSTGWVSVPVETCDTQKGFYCNSNLGSCSNATGPCHPFGIEGNFPCTSKGVFPDPYDCQKYHMCYFVGLTLVAASVDCGADKAFNPATGDCSLMYYNSICTEPQFRCDRAGDAKPWPGNANIFYICHVATNQNIRVLYPTLYRCNPGEVFDGYFCHSDETSPIENTTDGIVTTTTTTDRYSKSSTDQSPTTKFPVVPTTKFPAMSKCTEVGLHADPNDCRSYYYCSAINGIMKHAKCPAGTYYSSGMGSCVIGSCRD